MDIHKYSSSLVYEHDLEVLEPPDSAEASPTSHFSPSLRHAIDPGCDDDLRVETSQPSPAAVHWCTSELLNLVVGEARVRVAKEGRDHVTHSDISSALSALGMKPYLEPLRAHIARHYRDGGSKWPQKRARSPTPGDETPSQHRRLGHAPSLSPTEVAIIDEAPLMLSVDELPTPTHGSPVLASSTADVALALSTAGALNAAAANSPPLTPIPLTPVDQKPPRSKPRGYSLEEDELIVDYVRQYGATKASFRCLAEQLGGQRTAASVEGRYYRLLPKLRQGGAMP